MRRTQSPGLKLLLGMLPPPNIGRGPGWIAQLAAFVPVEILAIAAQGHCANPAKHSHEACIVDGVDVVTGSKDQSFVVHYRCLFARNVGFSKPFSRPGPGVASRPIGAVATYQLSRTRSLVQFF